MFVQPRKNWHVLNARDTILPAGYAFSRLLVHTTWSFLGFSSTTCVRVILAPVAGKVLLLADLSRGPLVYMYIVIVLDDPGSIKIALSAIELLSADHAVLK